MFFGRAIITFYDNFPGRSYYKEVYDHRGQRIYSNDDSGWENSLINVTLWGEDEIVMTLCNTPISKKYYKSQKIDYRKNRKSKKVKLLPYSEKSFENFFNEKIELFKDDIEI